MKSNFIILFFLLPLIASSQIRQKRWRQVSGPIQALIFDYDTYNPRVEGLNVPGIYEFELTVWDSLWASDSDTMKVTVQHTALPVKILRFWGEKESTYNLIKWVVDGEVNNKEFVLWRGGDSLNVQKIATIPGRGTATGLHGYEYRDNQPLPIGYYWLQQIDFDGRSSNSDMIVIKRNTNQSATIQNPVIGDIRIRLYSTISRKVPIKIYASDGKLLHQSFVMVMAGFSEHIIPAQLPAGVYFVDVAMGEESFRTKIIK